MKLQAFVVGMPARTMSASEDGFRGLSLNDSRIRCSSRLSIRSHLSPIIETRVAGVKLSAVDKKGAGTLSYRVSCAWTKTLERAGTLGEVRLPLQSVGG